MNETTADRVARRPGGGKETEMFGEAVERAVRVAAAPGLATLARDVASGLRKERLAVERVRLARQTAGYD